MSTPILDKLYVEAVGFDVYYAAPPTVGAQWLTLGTVAKEDFSLNEDIHVKDLQSSSMGETIAEGIYLGKSVSLSLVLNEINRETALKLINSPSEGRPGELGQPGAVTSYMGGRIRLAPVFTSLPVYGDADTVISGHTSGQSVLHFERTFLQNGQTIKRLLAAQRHSIPLILQVYPWADPTTGKLKMWDYRATATSP